MTSSTSTNYLSMLTQPLIAGGLLLIYNALIDSKGLGMANLIDCAYLSGSVLASNTIVNLLIPQSSSLFGSTTNTQMIENYIINPGLSSFIYNYLFDNYYRNQYNLANNRTGNMNYLVSFGASFASEYFESPILSLLTSTGL